MRRGRAVINGKRKGEKVEAGTGYVKGRHAEMTDWERTGDRRIEMEGEEGRIPILLQKSTINPFLLAES